MKKSISLLLITAHTLLTGCVPLPPLPSEQAAVQHCPVCSCHRDFGCLLVKKTSSTPSAEFRGRRYWFCSETCRQDFQKSPRSFLPRS